MEECTKLFSKLSIDDKKSFFKQQGIKSHGWLYAYHIPAKDVQVVVTRESRDGTIRFLYESKPGDWCLINMGSTTQLKPQRRLDYFRKFHKKIKPYVSVVRPPYDSRNTDLMYCVEADTAWEMAARSGCSLGGWDIGGKTERKYAYFTSAADWKKFLLKSSHSIGPTECAVIPTSAFIAIKKLASSEYMYPYTAKFVKQIEGIVRSETLKLFDEKDYTQLRRDSTVTLKIVRWDDDEEGPMKTHPWDHSSYFLEKNI